MLAGQADYILPLLDSEDDPAAIGEQIAEGYRASPQGADENAWAEANAREAVRQEQR